MYKVKFTDNNTGKLMFEHYTTAARAKEVVNLTYTRHGDANVSAEYLGKK